MSQRRKPPLAPGTILQVDITGLSEHGQGVGTAQDRQVAIHGALPGDGVRARVTWASPTSPWTTADLVEVLRPSPERVPNPCPHGPRCVGCPLVALSAPAQLREKRLRLVRALREAGLEALAVPEVIPAPTPLGYRCRAKYVVAPCPGGFQLGAYAPGSHAVLPTTSCLVTAPSVAAAARALEGLLDPTLVVEGPRLRYVVLRGNGAGQLLGTLVVQERGHAQSLAEAWVRAVPSLVGVVEHVNVSSGDNLLDATPGAETLLTGTDHLPDHLAGVPVRVPSLAFTQLHAQAAEGLYAHVARLLAPLEGLRVLDAYCGLGGFAFALRGAARVSGVDDNGPSITAATEAATAAGLTHVGFLREDAAAFLERAAAAGERPDVVVVDPPRKGLAPAALHALAALRPPRLVYVACEPRALARDSVTLAAAGFRLETVTPFDLFPQTPEVETVALFQAP